MVDLSDTPAGMLSRLDASLAAHGQTISIRRTGGSSLSSVPAFVRGYKPEHIAGLIHAGDMQVIVSASSLTSYGAPAAGDLVEIAGKLGTVQEDVEAIRIGTTLIRVNMRVRMPG